DIRICATSMNQLSTWCIDESAVHQMPSSKFHLLTECTNVHRLVAFNAADVVVSWSKTIRDGLTFREDEFVVFKPAVAARGGRHRFVDAFVDRGSPNAETVEQVIGFGVHVGGRCLGCSLTFDNLGFAQG